MAKRREGRCDWCDGPGPLHRHHLTYKRYKNELPEDCVYICQLCHGDQHPHDPRLPHARDRKLLKPIIEKNKRQAYARMRRAEKRRKSGGKKRKRRLTDRQRKDIVVEGLIRRGWKRVAIADGRPRDGGD